jgi:hypothetical protein
MLDYLTTAKRYLSASVEIGFLAIPALLLIYLILGQGSGVFVTAVADNVLKFANAIPAQSLVGIALGLAPIVSLRDPSASAEALAAFSPTSTGASLVIRRAPPP